MLKRNIGENAGLIWRLLDKETEMSFSALHKKSKLCFMDFYLAIGWLLRENKIHFFHKEKEEVLYVCLIE